MLFKYLLQAYKGKYYWTKLKKTYGNGKMPSKYILFPEEDNEYNAWGLCFLEHYIKKNELDKVMILATDIDVLEAVKNVQHTNMHLEKISKSKMKCLIRYSALVPRNEEWVIVSVKQPYDTGAERLLGKKGVTKREIVWFDVYRMSKEIDNKLIEKIPKWEKANKFLNYLVLLENKENETI